jgi:catechol 2,3-dioxygenase-like lactoylglutathione lyase family enzyme
MLTRLIGFVTTKEPTRARRFYGEQLQFRFVSEDDFAIVFDANGTMLRVVKGATAEPRQHTILGWESVDIVADVRALASRGVLFEQYGLAFMPQDELGIWTAPNGDKVAWFKDPDGNVLSLSTHVQS